jgi:hypothetical protein
MPWWWTGAFIVASAILLLFLPSTDIATLYQDAEGTTPCQTEVAEADGTGTPSNVDGVEFSWTNDGEYAHLDDVDVGN